MEMTGSPWLARMYVSEPGSPFLIITHKINDLFYIISFFPHLFTEISPLPPFPDVE